MKVTKGHSDFQSGGLSAARSLVHAVLSTASAASRPRFCGVGTPVSGDVGRRETVPGDPPLPSGAASSRGNTRRVALARL